MHDHRNRDGFKALTGQMGVAFTGCRWQRVTLTVGKLYGTALEMNAVVNHPWSGEAAARVLDLLTTEPLAAIRILECAADIILQLHKIVANRLH